MSCADPDNGVPLFHWPQVEIVGSRINFLLLRSEQFFLLQTYSGLSASFTFNPAAHQPASKGSSSTTEPNSSTASMSPALWTSAALSVAGLLAQLPAAADAHLYMMTPVSRNLWGTTAFQEQ